MIFYCIIGAILIVAILAAIILVIAVSKTRTSKPSGTGPSDIAELDEEQAAVIASTWTSLNPPS